MSKEPTRIRRKMSVQEPAASVPEFAPQVQRPSEPPVSEQVANMMQQIREVTGVAPGDAVVQPLKEVTHSQLVTLEGQPPSQELVDALKLTHPNIVATPAANPITLPPAPQVPAPLPPRAAVHGINVSDIVQVVNRENRSYGVTFIVGDIRGMRVHGFYLLPGGKKEFVTVEVGDLANEKGIAIIGQSRVLSHSPCSKQWIQEHPQAFGN